MNIFAIAWNLPDLNANRIQAELRVMAETYPALDPATVWSQQGQNGSFIASSISSPHEVVQPRNYVHRGQNQITLYTGLPVDPENDCAAHRAEDLKMHWPAIRDRLEGTYAVVKINDTPAHLEIQTDILGGEPVYYSRHKDGCLFSNSVLLIERLTNFRSLDELGVSMYLHLGHALGDRTLREGIRVICGGQRWTWSGADNAPRIVEYYPVSRLGELTRRKFSISKVSELAENLQKPFSSLASHFDTLVCPLTGGKDSRVIASLLINAGISARYFTFGEPDGEDTKIATSIATIFDLNHEIKRIEPDDVVANWDKNCLRNVRAADGMRSLYLMAGLSKSKPLNGNKRDIYLWGACGEVARSFFGNLPFLRPGLTVEDINGYLKASGPENSSGLISPESISRAKAWRERYFDECADQGIRPIDIPDLYGNHAVDGRRLGNNGRALAGTRDTYTPFATRAFLEAAFSIRSLQRYTEPLHYNLTKHLVPQLHAMPLANNAWRAQNQMLNLLRMRVARKARQIHRRTRHLQGLFYSSEPEYRYRDSMFNRLNWLESKRHHILELSKESACLPVWNFVRRDRFEKIMSAHTHRSVRSRDLQLLFHIATLLYYESDAERKSLRCIAGTSKTGT